MIPLTDFPFARARAFLQPRSSSDVADWGGARAIQLELAALGREQRGDAPGLSLKASNAASVCVERGSLPLSNPFARAAVRALAARPVRLVAPVHLRSDSPETPERARAIHIRGGDASRLVPRTPEEPVSARSTTTLIRGGGWLDQLWGVTYAGLSPPTCGPCASRRRTAITAPTARPGVPDWPARATPRKCGTCPHPPVGGADPDNSPPAGSSILVGGAFHFKEHRNG